MTKEPITLRKVFEEYISARHLKPNTLKGYKLMLQNSLRDWLDLPIYKITKQMVVEKHKALSESRPATANSALRVLRALLSYAECVYEDANGNPLIQNNPVKMLARIRGWNRVRRRTSVIAPHQMPAWFNAVESVQNKTVRDFLKFTLFTGLRHNEAASLQWSNVDFQERSITIDDTKNHERHVLPLSSYLQDLLTARWHDRKTNKYVFPSLITDGHLADVRGTRKQIAAKTGINFTVHDLRRTFASCADSLDISPYTVKRLLNHKLGSDVTAGYVISDVERLREAMEQITSRLLELASGAKQPNNLPILNSEPEGNGKKPKIRMPVNYAHHFVNSQKNKATRLDDPNYLRWLSSFPLKPLLSETHYLFAKQVFQQCASQRTQDTLSGTYLDSLLNLITVYEHQKWSKRMKLSPQEALKDVMREKGLSQHDITKILLHKSTVSEFLAGKHNLRSKNALKLAETLAVEPELFMPRDL